MSKAYEVHYEPGSFAGADGSIALANMLNAYAAIDGAEVVTVVPIIDWAMTKGVHIVLRRVETISD